MRRLYIPIITLLFSLVFITACNKSRLEEINVDPNSPADVSPNLLLSSSEGGLAYALGGDGARYTSIFMQYLEGTDRQFESIHNYSFNETDTDNMWRFNLYGGALNDLYLLNKSSEGKNPHYAGVAKLMLGYSLLATTDLFGDIPYTEAFQGAANLNPKYDKQADVYASVRAMIAKARTELAATSPLSPGAEDNIYGGDLDKWLKFADVLEARTYLHYKDYNNALTAITGGKGFASNGDNAVFGFGTDQTSSNPWYQFAQDRAGYITYQGQFETMLTTLADPRAATYKQIQDATGSVASGNIFGGVDGLIPFATYFEQKFIEAECRFKTEGATQATYDAYIAGVTASLEFCGVSGTALTDYLANPSVGVGASNLTLQTIMNQKYIAMFSQLEAWTDYRRTGFPTLTPTQGTMIPTRFPYAETERLYNTNTPSGLSIYDKVDWNK